MIKSKKICIFPNNKTRTLFMKSCGVGRNAYNWAKRFSDLYYKLYHKSISTNALRRAYTKYRRQNTNYSWIREVSVDIPKQAIKDYGKARDRFFKTKKGFPKYKSKKNSKLSFYCDTFQTKLNDKYVFISKIGWVKTNTVNNETKIYNPRITFDGKYWYLSYGYDVDDNQVMSYPLTVPNNRIGIDLGIKNFAITSDGLVIPNFNKEKRIRYLNKKLKRIQRKVSRKYLMNKIGNQFIKTKNIIKLEKLIRLIHRSIKNIRLDNINKAVANILRMGNSFVIENLGVQNMMKNKHLSRAIGEMGWRIFRTKLEQKCKFYSLELNVVPRFYPSSKTCSSCNNIKKDLKLKDRTYKCDCGLKIDRDLNAAINLKNYRLAI